jgi:hypothetical protein
MAFNTKAFAAQDALTAALQARSELAAWRIDFGIPAGRPEEQHIWLDESVGDWTQESATTGVTSRNEGFQMYVYIYDKKSGADAKEIRDEVKTAADIITDTLGTAPFLNGVVMFAEITALAYEGAFADTEGRAREGVLKLTIACQSFVA